MQSVYRLPLIAENLKSLSMILFEKNPNGSIRENVTEKKIKVEEKKQSNNKQKIRSKYHLNEFFSLFSITARFLLNLNHKHPCTKTFMLSKREKKAYATKMMFDRFTVRWSILDNFITLLV